MKVLFLDDNAERHSKFKVANIGINITYVWTSIDAINALKATCFDEVYLDHDLGGEKSEMTLPAYNEGSGYDVAVFISEMPEDRRPYKVVIHSYNPVGAKRMEDVLKTCQGMIVRREPFDF